MSKSREVNTEKSNNRDIVKSTRNLNLILMRMSFREKCLLFFFLYLCVFKDPALLLTILPLAAAASTNPKPDFKAERNDPDQFSNPETICTYTGLTPANKPDFALGLDTSGYPIPESCTTDPKSDVCTNETKKLKEFKKTRGFLIDPKLDAARRFTAIPQFEEWSDTIKVKLDEFAKTLTRSENSKFFSQMEIIRKWGLKFFNVNAGLKVGMGGCGEQNDYAVEKFIKWANTHPNRKLVVQEVDLTIGCDNYANDPHKFENHVFMILDSGTEDFLPGVNFDNPESLKIYKNKHGKAVVQDVLKKIDRDATICDPWNGGKYSRYGDDNSRFYKSDRWQTITITTIPLKLNLKGLPERAVNFICEVLKGIDLSQYIKECKSKTKSDEKASRDKAVDETSKRVIP